MSTRTNVVVMESKRATKTVCQIYRHSDGYPECTGKDLQDYINQLMLSKEDDIKEVMKSAQTFAKFICECDECFRYEGKLDLDDDIEYLYVIDLQTKTVTCYAVQMPSFWAHQIISSDMDFIQNKAHGKYISFFGEQCEESRFIYKMRFTDYFDKTYRK